MSAEGRPYFLIFGFRNFVIFLIKEMILSEVPLEAGRVWPAGFPGPLQGQQQLQYLQQQYAQHLQQLQQSQSQQQQQTPVTSASGNSGGTTGSQIKTEAPCRQEEQAAAVHYQQLHRRQQHKVNLPLSPCS